MAPTTQASRQLTKILTWNTKMAFSRGNQNSLWTVKKIDIALISESHFTSRFYTEIRNYKLYKCNHPSDVANGGAALYIHNIK